ncbi:hypothetical protein [Myxococcus faecalis]|uniref:hypothetical protein n=1 Tax=Myxococcus faecalis TaxID=3115646 RepID=UPI003CEC712A
MSSTVTKGAPSLWFILLPLPAILLGAVIARRIDVPFSPLAINGVAALLGAAVALIVVRRPSTALLRAAVPVAVIATLLTAATLLFPGLDGIRRWLALGPIRLHASSVLVPWVLLGISAALRGHFPIAAALAVVLSAIHAAQPDAGQATAFALAASLLLARAHATSWLSRALSCTAVLGVSATAWLRPDPLEPVDHVERIFQLAFRWPPLIGLIAGLALAFLLVPGLAGITRAVTARHDDALLSLSASFVLYFAAAFAVTELGHFPVPVMGTGAGHILGWYSASGILAALVWPRDTRVPIVART